MMAMCNETVSILYALIFGAGEACVRIDLWSILTAFGAFMVIVVILQWIARRIWARFTEGPGMATPNSPSPSDKPFEDNPRYRESAIRSSRR